jgi:hypothetical protein
MGKQKFQDWVIASTSGIQCTLNFFMNAISYFYWDSQTVEHPLLTNAY